MEVMIRIFGKSRWVDFQGGDICSRGARAQPGCDPAFVFDDQGSAGEIVRSGLVDWGSGMG